jgi:hypothetical protein
MAALTAASWTVVVQSQSIEGKRKRVVGTLALAGTDTYPTGGVPLPTKDKFGFKRLIDAVEILGHNAGATTSYVFMYDPTNYKLQIYEEEAAAAGGPLLECDGAEVPGPRTFNFVARGW